MRSLQSIGYSKGSLSDIHSLIHHALDYAVYPAELISSNPANYIKVPKKAPTNIVKRHIITPKKLNELLEENPFGSPYYIPILILYHTGMRIGEVCGLTWNAIDFDKNIVTLDKQIVHINNQGDYFSTPKTKTSNRIIMIDDFLASELKRWKNQQAENETTAGDSYANIYRADDNKLIQQSKGLGEVDAEKVNLVCTDESGRAVRKLRMSNFFTRKGLNAHSFRHTHATTLIENGATAKGVAGRLGHSSTLITQNLYTHNTKKLQEDTVEIFTKTLQTNS